MRSLSSTAGWNGNKVDSRSGEPSVEPRKKEGVVSRISCCFTWKARMFFLVLLLLSFAGCASLPENVHQIRSTVIKDGADTTLGREISDEAARHPGASGFLLLDNGLNAFVARAALADLAEHSIDVQYYLFHDDLVGGLLAYKLLEAADRGVRVRLLLDDMGLEGRDRAIATLDSHPNIEIRIFNPFTRGSLRSLQMLTRFGQVTRRMHNKSFTVDNQAAVVGGRNIGNEYFDADPELTFGDLDVLAIGPVVAEVSSSFDEYWNNVLSYPITSLKQKLAKGTLEEMRPIWQEQFNAELGGAYVKALQNSTFAQEALSGTLEYHWGKAEVLVDKPEKISSSTQTEENYLAPQLVKYIDQVEGELIILSAYFVPGRHGVDFLKALSKRGVRVRILTNSLTSTDVTIVHAGYAGYRREMLRAGIELYELDKELTSRERKEKRKNGITSKASLHAKTYILDRRALFIGSFNFDPRSIFENTEIGIYFDAPAMATAMAGDFDKKKVNNAFKLELITEDDGMELIRWVTTKFGEKKVYYTEPHTSVWRRFLLSLAGFLPIESQL